MNSSISSSSKKRVLVLSMALLMAGGLAGGCCCGGKAKDGKGTCCTCQAESAKAKDASSLKPQTMCPVMGDKINKSLYTDVRGYRIYVCCSGCISEINKDPDKYIKKLQDMGVEIEKAPEKTKAAK